MSRDHRKLRVFHQAHKLTLAIYQHTHDFPRDEPRIANLRTRLRTRSRMDHDHRTEQRCR